MQEPAPKAAECGNRLLALLPEPEYQNLRPHLKYIPTPTRFVIYERNKPITHVYFPLSGAHSVLAIMEDGSAVEVGTVGNEGFSSVDVLTGTDIALETTVSQVPGAALRLPLDVFRSAIKGESVLQNVLNRFLQAYLAQVSQSVACNRLHSLEQRFARWVLMSHDRAGGKEFQLTQEYLADMLGVYRPSVSLVARTFQQAGILRYSRGTIEVLDRNGWKRQAANATQPCAPSMQGRLKSWPADGRPFGSIRYVRFHTDNARVARAQFDFFSEVVEE